MPGFLAAAMSSTCVSGGGTVCEFNGGVQLCKTDAECRGEACAYKRCRNLQFFSCGALPSSLDCGP
jgi:hypothetical protein